MTTNTATAGNIASRSVLMPAIAAFVIGFGLIFMSGLVQAETLHDAAHDVRHATGFPCH